jgi:hypothetical protein
VNRYSPLRRSTPLRATKPMRQRSASKPGESAAEKAARKAVKDRSNGRCEVRYPDVCTGDATDWQHRQNRSQSGKWLASNGLHACRPCHAHIHANPAEAYEYGWSVPAWKDPAATPVFVDGEFWKVPDDAGGWTNLGPERPIRDDHRLSCAIWRDAEVVCDCGDGVAS